MADAGGGTLLPECPGAESMAEEYMRQKKIILWVSAAFLILTAAGGICYSLNMRSENLEIEYTPLAQGRNTAVFAAYSADGTVADYVVSYLKKLKEIAPNIIFITDNPMRRREAEKLRPYANIVIARRHGEYDWGSYKRGYALLRQEGLVNADGQNSDAAPYLIFANDSALLVAPSLKPVLQAAEKSRDAVFGITANADGFYHLQSYFMMFMPQVYTTPEFAAYLNAVRPQKDGLTVAYRYEVPFTGYLQNLGFTAATLIPYEQLSYLPLNDKNCYPLTLLANFHAPFLKMRTFTERLNVQEPRRLVFNWLQKNAPDAYQDLLEHLEKINSPYLKEAR